MDDTNKSFLIFSGFNQRAIIAFIRVLNRHNIKYFIVAAGNDDSIFKSSYSNDVIFTRKNKKLSIESIVKVLDVILEHNGDQEIILAPSTESINRFFLRHRSFFQEKNVTVPLVNEKLYNKISDKMSFGKICKKSNITLPDLIFCPETTSLPFVAKPISYDASKNLYPLLIYTEQDRKKLLRSKYIDHYYFQEYIYGRSYYLLLFMSKNNKTYRFSQENLLQLPNGKSIVAAKASDFHLTKESDKYINMLKKLDFQGLIMIEVRSNKNTYYMIEANPRFWGPSQLFVDSMKEDLFDAFLMDLGFKKIIPKKHITDGKYFWFGGLMDALRKNKKMMYHHKFSPILLAKDFDKWIDADIYLRNDTINIFARSLIN